ncbi:MAG: C40 family peptidase [Pseudomonadota bacterium]|jgi:cell wall-associated NlpC family hydrolase
MVAFINFTNGEASPLESILPVAGSKVLQGVCLASTMLLVTGCASSTKQASTAVPDNYFAMSLPDMPGSHDLMMSPADHSTALQDYGSSYTSAAVRQALLAQHQRWVGTPYRLGGTNERGIDCSALIQNVYRDTFNLQLPRTTRQQVKQGRQIDRSELQPGDLVFFNPPGAVRHAGIYVGGGRFMHASSSKGVMISRLDNSYWQRYYWQSRRTLEPTHLAGLADSLQR